MPTPPGPGVREEPGFVRDLGAMERILHFYASEHPRHFCVVAEIEGTIDPAKCRAAFDAVQAGHPMLSVCVRDDPQRGPGIYRCDRPLKVGFSSVDEEPDWRRVVERELATPFADSEGPLMRATVMYGAHGASIVLTSHHVLSDGMSAVFIVQDLMEALDGRPLARLPELPSQERLVADVLLPEGRTIDPEMPDGLDERRLRAIADAPLWRPFEGDTPLVHTIEFDAPFSARLRRRSRETATTLNGALCAALVQCVAEADRGRETCAILSAINCRPLVRTADRDCGLLVRAAATTYALHEAGDFWALARRTNAAVVAARSSEGVIRSFAAMEACVPKRGDSQLACGYFGAFQYDAVLSNLGALPIPAQVGALRLKAVWGTAVQGRFVHERVFGAASFDGRLRIVQTSPKVMLSILEPLREKLAQACE